MLANIKLMIEQAYDLGEILGLFESCMVGLCFVCKIFYIAYMRSSLVIYITDLIQFMSFSSLNFLFSFLNCKLDACRLYYRLMAIPGWWYISNNIKGLFFPPLFLEPQPAVKERASALATRCGCLKPDNMKSVCGVMETRGA